MQNSANEVLSQVDEDHDYKHEPEDTSSTPGIQKALARNRHAIQALADFIDGKRTNGGSNQRDAEADRIEKQKAEAKSEWKAGTPPGPNGPDDFGNKNVKKQTPANMQKPAS